VSLFELVQQGVFDARLFYRLNVVHVVASRALDDECTIV
jgi:transcriptional regulator of aromatic amino acid metabolism